MPANLTVNNSGMDTIPNWHGTGDSRFNTHTWVIGSPSIGEGTWIGAFCVIDGSGGLTIGSNCEIASGAHLYTHSSVARAVSNGKEPIDRRPTLIGDNCHIGANAVVLMGCVIGSNSVIGAGAVVTEGTVVPENSVLVGVPAKIVYSES